MPSTLILRVSGSDFFHFCAVALLEEVRAVSSVLHQRLTAEPSHRRVPTVSNRSGRIYPRLHVEFRFDQLLRVPYKADNPPMARLRVMCSANKWTRVRVVPTGSVIIYFVVGRGFPRPNILRVCCDGMSWAGSGVLLLGSFLLHNA